MLRRVRRFTKRARKALAAVFGGGAGSMLAHVVLGQLGLDPGLTEAIIEVGGAVIGAGGATYYVKENEL